MSSNKGKHTDSVPGDSDIQPNLHDLHDLHDMDKIEPFEAWWWFPIMDAKVYEAYEIYKEKRFSWSEVFIFLVLVFFPIILTRSNFQGENISPLWIASYLV